MSSKFYVFEGIDGSGKSTAAEIAYKHLRKKNIPCHITNEPSSKGFRPVIKQIIAANSYFNDARVDALLYSADRIYHLETEIIPALKEGKIVISDRYYHSTLAYQQVAGLDFDWLYEMNKFAKIPDKTIIFDVPPEVSLKRMKYRKSSDKFEVLDFMKKLRIAYFNLPHLLKDEDIVIIDANRPRKMVADDVKKYLNI